MIDIALFEPEKPANVGNIIRTCQAFNLTLSIIGNITFDLSEKSLKRAEMDYGIGFEIKRFETISEYISKMKKTNGYFVTRYSKNTYTSFDYSNTYKDYFFMFGKESTGIPKDVLKENIDKTIRIPMSINSRSLNLSNCVSIISSEVLRQQNFKDLATVETIKGKDFLDEF